MEFTKYKERGAYHWEEYAMQTIYGRYADTIPKWIKEKRVLDIGAGDGLITHLLNAIGIEENEEAVKLAREKGVAVYQGTAYELPYFDEEFEAVFMGDVLEHLEFPEKAIEEAKRVSNKYLYITTPPAREDRVLQDKFHYREYTPEELTDFIESFGFKLVEPITINYQRMYAKFSK